MHHANPARTRFQGLSWYRRVLAAVVALLIAATMAMAGATSGESTAAGADDSAVVAGGSWSNARSLMRIPADMLGASWS